MTASGETKITYPVTKATDKRGLEWHYTYFDAIKGTSCQNYYPSGVYRRTGKGSWMIMYSDIQALTAGQLIAIAEILLYKERMSNV